MVVLYAFKSSALQSTDWFAVMASTEASEGLFAWHSVTSRAAKSHKRRPMQLGQNPRR